MFGDMIVEPRWANIVHTLQLRNNRWIRGMYKRKYMWASAYIRGTFFAGMRTTQQCESINDILKEHFKRRMKLYKFVEEMDRVLLRIKNNELADDYKLRHTNVELSMNLKVYEEHAAQVYTRALFAMVRDKIIEEHEFVAEKVFCNTTYDMFVVRKSLQQEKQ